MRNALGGLGGSGRFGAGPPSLEKPPAPRPKDGEDEALGALDVALLAEKIERCVLNEILGVLAADAEAALSVCQEPRSMLRVDENRFRDLPRRGGCLARHQKLPVVSGIVELRLDWRAL